MATPWGAYEGVVKPDLDAGSGLRGGKSKTLQPDPWATIRRADQTGKRHATSDTGLTLRCRFEETYIRRLTAVTIRWPQFSQHQK